MAAELDWRFQVPWNGYVVCSRHSVLSRDRIHEQAAKQNERGLFGRIWFSRVDKDKIRD